MLLALARGLPRRSEILALPRQRFDGVSARLGRALHANAHAHRVALAALGDAAQAASRRQGARKESASGLSASTAQRARALSSLGGAVAPAPRCAHGRSSTRSAITTCSRAASRITRDAEGAACCAAPPTFIAGERLDIEFADGHVPAQADGGDRKATASPKRARRPRRKAGHIVVSGLVSGISRRYGETTKFELGRSTALMNRFERNIGFKGEAKLKYLDGEVQVVTPGDFVRCAVTGRIIPLEELRYWSVELQEAYVDAATSLKRFRDTRRQPSSIRSNYSSWPGLPGHPRF